MTVLLALLGGGFLGTLLSQFIEDRRVNKRREEDRRHALNDARLLRRQETYTEALSATVRLRAQIGIFDGGLVSLGDLADHLSAAMPDKSPDERAEQLEDLALIYRSLYETTESLTQLHWAAASAAWATYPLAPVGIQDACVRVARSYPTWRTDTRLRLAEEPAPLPELRVHPGEVRAVVSRVRPKLAELASHCLELEDLLRGALDLDAEDRLQVTNRRWLPLRR